MCDECIALSGYEIEIKFYYVQKFLNNFFSHNTRLSQPVNQDLGPEDPEAAFVVM